MNETEKNKALMLEQLKKTPIIQIACEKTGISRMTFYRWKKEDKEFAKAVDESILDGRYVVNDLAEATLVNEIKRNDLKAVIYWLKNHHPDYAATLNLKHTFESDEMTPEQETLVREALRLSGSTITQLTEQTHDTQSNDGGIPGGASGAIPGSDDRGQES